VSNQFESWEATRPLAGGALSHPGVYEIPPEWPTFASCATVLFMSDGEESEATRWADNNKEVWGRLRLDLIHAHLRRLGLPRRSTKAGARRWVRRWRICAALR